MIGKYEGLKNPLPLGVELPEIEIPSEDYEKVGLEDGASNYEFLRHLCLNSVKEKGISKLSNKQDYYDRVKMELDVLDELGFVDYILLNWDVLNFCKRSTIPVGRGRGCLTANAQIATNKGIKRLCDVEVGDTVINKNGHWDDVVGTMTYECDEELVSFKTSYSTFDNFSMTKDHKVLAVKNPFKHNAGQSVLNWKEGVDALRVDNHEWVEADHTENGDYLIRFVGRSNAEKDMESIDLSEFAKDFDDEWIYEKHPINTHHLLSIRGLHKDTNISRNGLKFIKSGVDPKKTNSRHKNNVKALESYLLSKGSSLQEFKDFKAYSIVKIPRHLPICEEFCYFLGFFIGDGWCNDSRVGIALHSEDNTGEMEKLEKYFDSLGLSHSRSKHNEKKLIQLYLNSLTFSKLFSKIVPFGAFNKSIPSEFMNLPKNKLEGIWRGLMESDGSYYGGRMAFDSISIKLTYQMRWISEYLGYKTSVGVRKFENHCKDCYKIRISNDESHVWGFNKGDFLYTKIIKKEYTSCENVYDLTVKKDPSYSTVDYIVHNSSGGSLILALIGVTDIDPIEHELFFERFISKNRARRFDVDGITYFDGGLLPDIDNDIDYVNRHRVIEYIEQKYPNRTSKILTLARLQPKICVKEALKIVGGYSEDHANVVSKFIPMSGAEAFPLKECAGESEKFAEWQEGHPKEYKIARKLEGLIKNVGVHASGIAISKKPLLDLVPLQYTKDGELVSGYDMKFVAEYAVKFDILGLKTLSIIAEAEKLTGIAPKSIDPRDSSIYMPTQNLEVSMGLFQIEGSTNLKVAKDVKPNSWTELSDCVAIGRPGALQFSSPYAKVKNGKEEIELRHPELDKILASTKGCILFQEQLMQIANKVFGFTLLDAETLRRIVGKKMKDEMPEWEAKIYKKAEELGIDESIAEFYWSALEASADYSFNKCAIPETIVETKDGYKCMMDVKKGEMVLAYNTVDGKDHFVEVLDIHENEVEVYEVGLDDGSTISCSMDHKFLCSDGEMHPVSHILSNDLEIMCKD